MTIVKVPKSGGVRLLLFPPVERLIISRQVVELDQAYRQRVQNYQLHTYMYGQAVHLPAGITEGLFGGENIADLVLSPSSTTVNFGDIKIYRIGTGPYSLPYFVFEDIFLQ